MWHHPDTPHAARGVEHAANLISWGVQSEPIDPERVELYAERLALYELLTGRVSPRVAHLHPAEAREFGIYDANAEERAVIEAQLDLFAAAGLALPQLRIFVHDDKTGYNGYLGVFSQLDDPHRIDICVLNDAVVRHELAHAWERHNATDPQRNTFMALIGAEAWFDTNLPHGERGVERAAQIIGWGINGAQFSELETKFFADMLAAYEALVSAPSPRLARAHLQDALAGRTGCATLGASRWPGRETSDPDSSKRSPTATRQIRWCGAPRQRGDHRG